MEKNLGKADRLVRGLVVTPLAIVLAALVGFGSILGIVLLVVAAIMLLTAVVGTCPLYRVIGMSTQRHAHG